MSGFTIPDDTGQEVTLRPTAVQTDRSTIDFTAEVTSSELERLSRYREAGDIETRSTAFGAFRRLSRDASEPVTLTPSVEFSPPFDTREVFPLDASVTQIAPTRHEIQLSFGLTEPRPRDAVSGSGDPETIGETGITLPAGATQTVSVTGTAPGTFGDYVATVTSPTDSDTELVSVSDADIIISWPVASLTIAVDQFGHVRRSSAGGRERVSVTLRLTPAQAAVLLAAGSRVPAAVERQVPDAANQIRDTLPGDELTATISAPDSITPDITGTVVLVDWSVTWTRPSATPIDAELTFAPV